MRLRLLYLFWLITCKRREQTSRLRDVIAAQHAHHVRQKLHWNDIDHGREILMRRRNIDNCVATLFQLFVAFLCDRDDATASSLHLLQIGNDLVVARIRWRTDHNHGHELVDQGNGSMLHLRGRISLRMDIGGLLTFARALECHGEVEASTHEDEVLGEHVQARDVPELALPFLHLVTDDLLDQAAH